MIRNTVSGALQLLWALLDGADSRVGLKHAGSERAAYSGSRSRTARPSIFNSRHRRRLEVVYVFLRMVTTMGRFWNHNDLGSVGCP